jgi:hypothetical protein
MRTHLVTIIVLFSTLLFGTDARLSPRFRTVYIMSMNNSFDLLIASHVTSSRVLWVVLDPLSADAVLTDTLDDGFWGWLARIYPAPAGIPTSGNRGAAYRTSNPPSNGNRGTIFLVDPRKRVVLWSTYDLPKNGSPNELSNTAAHIASQLKSAFAKK